MFCTGASLFLSLSLSTFSLLTNHQQSLSPYFFHLSSPFLYFSSSRKSSIRKFTYTRKYLLLKYIEVNLRTREIGSRVHLLKKRHCLNSKRPFINNINTISYIKPSSCEESEVTVIIIHMIVYRECQQHHHSHCTFHMMNSSIRVRRRGKLVASASGDGSGALMNT